MKVLGGHINKVWMDYMKRQVFSINSWECLMSTGSQYEWHGAYYAINFTDNSTKDSASNSLWVQRPMFRWSKVRQQHCHLVEWPPPDSFVITTARQIITNLLLVDPQQAVQRYDVGVTDEWQAVIACVQRLTVRCYLNEEPAQHMVTNNRRTCSNTKTEISSFRPQAKTNICLQRFVFCSR